MGIFANEPLDGLPGNIGPIVTKQAWHGQSGFEAMGHVVPAFRKSIGEDHLKAMGFTDSEKRFELVNAMSIQIERDNTHKAMEEAYKKGLDVTGTYRLLSVLLTAEEPA